MMKTLSKDKTYAAGRCPLKKQCLWHTMKHTEASCIDVSRFDGKQAQQGAKGGKHGNL